MYEKGKEKNKEKYTIIMELYSWTTKSGSLIVILSQLVILREITFVYVKYIFKREITFFFST